MTFRRSGVVSLFCLAACGGAPPGPVAPPPPAPDLKVNTAKEPPVDISPAPEPENLVMLARVNKPDALVKTFGTWTHLPLPGGRELLRQVNGALADVVDLSQPVDAAVSLLQSRNNVEPLYAFSVGVRSFDEARARLSERYKTDNITNGSVKIRGLFDHGGERGRGRADARESDDDDDEVCVLAHAANGGKLVCGPGGAVDTLTPYLARTMPRETWKSDLHLEIRPAPVRAPLQMYRGMLPMLVGKLFSGSNALRELVDASVGEAADLVEDAQKISVDATLDDNGIKGTSRIDFQGTKSLMARALTDASRADTAPAAFWHLPGDTDTAFFMRGSDPKLYDRPREILASLLTETLEGSQLPAAEKKAVRDLVADKMLRLFTNGGTGIYAKGFDQTSLDKAREARAKVKDTDFVGQARAERAIGEQMIGWHLYQVSDPIAKVGPILKDWSALWNRPAFAQFMEHRPGKSAKDVPKLRVTAAPANLPKDTVHLELSINVDDATPPPPSAPGQKPPPAPKAAPSSPIVVHVLAVPDGGATWLGFGLDGKVLAAKASQALASAPEAGTLGKTAQGVELLKEPKINGGGLVTLRGFLVLTAMDEKAPYESLAGLPGKGAIPIVFTGKAEPKASTGQLIVSRQVIEDIVKFAFSQK
jgi:hypothetical protein